ncbi:MAG: hypothetical protein Q8O25_01390 [Sulfurisoma sp.]|nr:hypothetical protein [Sulfurisoma sp.]
MPTRQISEISAAAKAAADCMKLPEHVRSLAATIERMARVLVAETNPDPAAIYTLEQAIDILDRWVDGSDCGADGLEPPASRAARQRSGAATNAFPSRISAL